MSRKSVQISIPASGVAPTIPARASARKPMAIDKSGIDSWVTQASGAAAESTGDAAFASPWGRDGGLSVTVRLTTEPNWPEAAKIFFFLPQAALWLWSLGMARRFMRGPYSWRL